MNNKQSSIDFMHDAFMEVLGRKRPMTSNEVTKIWLQAKATHKEEMIQSYSNGWHDGQDIIINGIAHIQVGGDAAGQKYYNETFGGEQ